VGISLGPPQKLSSQGGSLAGQAVQNVMLNPEFISGLFQQAGKSGTVQNPNKGLVAKVHFVTLSPVLNSFQY